MNVVEAPVDRDALLGPQRAEHGDLLLENRAALLEGHAERVVLELVPSDPEPEPEAATAQQVDLGRLLGQQRRLALGPDQDGGGERQVRAGGQVGEHGQRLAERVVDRVRPTDVPVHRDVTAEHMVVRRQVGVAQIGGGLAEGAARAPRSPPTSVCGKITPMSICRSLPCSGSSVRARPGSGAGTVSLGAVLVRIFVEPQQGASYDTLVTMAQAAEAAGFDAFFRSDHFLAMGGDGLPGPTDAWVTLGGIARETERIRLGTLVTSATFRLPGLLAVEVAQVDAMSGGRVELGLGAGWYDAEHSAYGVPFPPLGERFERLEEQFAILTGLWCTPLGEHFSFDGRHYHLKDSPALPKAVAAAPPTAHRRWRRAQEDAPARRHLRPGVQPAVLLARRHRGPVRPCARRVRGAGPRARDAAALGRTGGVLRRRRSRSAAPRRQHRSPARRAPGQRRGRHTRRGGDTASGIRRHRSADDVSPGPRPRRPRAH